MQQNKDNMLQNIINIFQTLLFNITHYLPIILKSNSSISLHVCIFMSIKFIENCFFFRLK